MKPHLSRPIAFAVSLLLAGCASAAHAPQTSRPESAEADSAAGPYPQAYVRIATDYLHVNSSLAKVSKPQLSADPAGWRVDVTVFKGNPGTGSTMKDPSFGAYHSVALIIRDGVVVARRPLAAKAGWGP